MNKKFYLVALAFSAMTMFTACDKNDNKDDDTPEDYNLIGELTENRTLSAGQKYTLSGGFHVKSGVTLTIEEGVTIEAVNDNIVDYILVEQGAKIDAQGSAEAPIIMTSQKKEAGAWGGLHICGMAPINVQGATSVSEVGDAAYGGSDEADNSGILRYIRIEYAGYTFSEEKEANGFTFYGVGNGTTVDHLQAYMGSDDGFEWFGGTVNVKYLVSTNNTDDSFDWTEGWRGKAQFLVAQQLSDECDCLVEADNNSKNAELSPVSCPVLSNVTLIGNDNADNNKGIRLRAGTYAKIYNTIVTGKANCVNVETPETSGSLSDGNSTLQYLVLSDDINVDEGPYTKEMFLADGTNKVNQSVSLSGIIGTVDGGCNASSIDSFFDDVTFIGAVESDNVWTSGGTR